MMLNAEFAKTTCPDEGELAELVEQSASVTVAARLEAHIADCDDCRRLAFALAGERVRELGESDQPNRIGRFEVIAEIGRGSMGQVYRAFDPELGRHVAIKIRHGRAGVDGDGDERLRGEAQALARLSHPNVVAVHEVGRHQHGTYVAMEYVDGVTLDRWLTTPRTRREVIAALAGAGHGLAAAHAVGLVHRDVNPHNIFISATGDAKIGDFGLVRLDAASDVEHRGNDAVASPDLTLTLSLTGSLTGTPAYMAPEQLCGEPATERSDQFGFCVTLFEALCGARPFAGPTIESLLAAIARGPAWSGLAAVPARLRGVLARGLALDPARRFPSMTALLAELSPRPTVMRWGVLGAVTGMAAAAAIAVTLLGSPSAAERCAERDASAAQTFGLERQQAILLAFVQHDPRAIREAQTVNRMLTDYGRRWDAANTSSCRATARGDRSAGRDRQRACLVRRLQRADDLGELLMRPAGALLANAARTVEVLPDPETCTSVEASLTDHDLPPAGLAPLIATLERRVDQVDNLRRLGRLADARREAEDSVAAARSVQFSPLLARALLAQELVAEGLEQLTGLEEMLDEAAREAAKARADELVAQAWTKRIDLVGELLGRFEDARRWIPIADAAILRAGDPPELRVAFHTHVGFLQGRQGNYAAARRELEAALAQIERSRPNAALEIANAQNNLAVLLYRIDPRNREAARELYERALATHRQAHGDLHRSVVTILNSLGWLYAEAAPRRAIAYLEEARALGEALLGPDSDLVSTTISNLGNAQYFLGDYAASVALHRRAYASTRAQLGPDHTKVALEAGNVAEALRKVGDADGAVQAYREAVAILERAMGPRDVLLAQVRSGLGGALQQAGDAAGAIAAFRAALAIYETGDAANGELAAQAQVELGLLLVMTGASTATIRSRFERAAPILARGEERNYRWLALAGIVYCDASDGRVDRQRVTQLEDAAASEGGLEPRTNAMIAYARARTAAALGDRPTARALGAASNAMFAHAALTIHRDAVARWLTQLR